MRFFRLYNKISTVTAGTATVPIDTKLTQDDDFWNNSFFYAVDGTGAGEVRRIKDFANSTGSVTLDRVITGLAADDQYQIFDLISPHQIHEYFNDALREAFPAWHEIEMNQDLVIQRDKRTYSLTGFTNNPWYIYKVWVENTAQIIRFTAASATATTIVAPDGVDLTDVNSNWRISIYNGTGQGESLAVSSVASQTITTSAWTSTPDNTSEVALWNAADETYDWVPIREVRVDKPEYPDTLYFAKDMGAYEGMRVRLQIATAPAAISNDTTTTIVPKEYLVLMVMNKAFNTMMVSRRGDRRTYSQLAAEVLQLALEYKEAHSFAPPSEFLWNSFDANRMAPRRDTNNPLGW
jgi:hypothetical protein